MVYFERYPADPAIELVFTPEFKISQFIKIETTWLKYLGLGLTDKNIEDAYSTEISVDEFIEKEKETNHDIAALVKCFVKNLGNNPAAKYVHLGLTSNDINDTVLGLQTLVINDTIAKKLDDLRSILHTKTWMYSKSMCCGRTHGQVATGMTVGQRFALWYSDVQDVYYKFHNAISYGKLAGAVGNFSAIKYITKKTDRECDTLERDALADIHQRLYPVFSKSQVVSRTIVSDFIYQLVLAASVCGKICHQIRHLSRTEVDEINEEFKDGSVGSSAMPHKKNPVRSERVCGLVKMLQPMIVTSLMNIDLDNERDMSNSSSERVMIENVARLTSFILNETVDIITHMKVNVEKSRENWETYRDTMLSELRMSKMTLEGTDRQDAYELSKNGSGGGDFSDDLFMYLPFGFDPLHVDPCVNPSQ